MTITLEQVSFAYGRVAALHAISAAASPGRITAVIGPNAAGKSTLLRCVIGALRPSSGMVRVEGTPIARLSARALAGRMAYVPQRSTVAAAFSVRQVIELGRYALPLRPTRIDQVMRSLELEDLASRRYPHLSVGQQQRVTLARALAQVEPDGHLVLDEPTSAMDLRHARQGMDLLRRLADRGATVLIAMHDLAAAAQLADDVWLLDRGQAVAIGPASEVLTVHRLEAVFGVRFHRLAGPDGRQVLWPSSSTPDDAIAAHPHPNPGKPIAGGGMDTI